MRRCRDWWPENPDSEEIFPMTTADYVAFVPDGKQRTALSGCLGRIFWNIASKSIFDAMKDHLDDEHHALVEEVELRRVMRYIGKRLNIVV